jgi:predicted DNA-binding protein
MGSTVSGFDPLKAAMTTFVDVAVECVYHCSSERREPAMARFMVSMPDDMLKKLDRQARKESRGRSELLREAVRRHLAATASVEAEERSTSGSNGKSKPQKKWTKEALERHLLENGLASKGCPGLDFLVGPVKGPVNMKQVLRITKKLAGLSGQLIEDREDRL